MTELLKYDDGLRVVVNRIDGVRSVASGFWVGVGSAYENEKINGLSHFTEHVNFKGTDELSAFEIAHKLESLGAQFNAFTSKEVTCFYVRSIDEFAENCFSLLSGIVLRSVYDQAELDKERKVVVEEINMVEDSPEDICYDELAAAVYGSEGLGRTILGPISNVERFSSGDVKDFVSRFYNSGNIVIALAGNVTTEQADLYVKKYVRPFLKAGERAKPYAGGIVARRASRVRTKDFEQANIALSFPSCAAFSPLSETSAIVTLALGGGMSSRLYQAVRERKGLAYSVYASPSAYARTGVANIFLNVSEANIDASLSAVREELDELLNDGLTDEEIERSKIQLKSTLVFSGESVQSVMASSGKSAICGDELFDVDEKIRRIDAVTKAGALEFIRDCFDYEKMNAAYVGSSSSVDILGKF